MRIVALATHPIQYLVPVLKALATEPDSELEAVFASDHGLRPGPDLGFEREVAWDTLDLGGLRHAFIPNRARHPSPETFFGQHSPTLSRELDGRFDVAILFAGYATRFGWQARAAVKRARIPWVNRLEFTDLRPPQTMARRTARRLVAKEFLRGASCSLAIGSSAARELRTLGLPPARIGWSPYCVDNRLWHRLGDEQRPRRQALREAWGLGDGDCVFLFVGKLQPKKRPLDLITAYGTIARRGNVGLIVVGSGPLERSCQDAAAGLPGVRFAGFRNQSELPAAYVAADVLVLPSDYGETWGLVVNEAMNFDLPAILSDRVGCAEDLIVEGETGFVFRCGDIEMLAASMSKMAASPDARRRMGKAAGERIASFGIDAAARGLRAACEASMRAPC